VKVEKGTAKVKFNCPQLPSHLLLLKIFVIRLSLNP
jgi:hypothetical protein